MQIEFMADAVCSLEILEVFRNGNIFKCPVHFFDPFPWFGAHRIKKFKMEIEYEIIPILEV